MPASGCPPVRDDIIDDAADVLPAGVARSPRRICSRDRRCPSARRRYRAGSAHGRRCRSAPAGCRHNRRDAAAPASSAASDPSIAYMMRIGCSRSACHHALAGPAAEMLGLVDEAQPHEGVDGERGVADPGRAIIPVAPRAGRLGQREGRRRRDRAVAVRGQQLERQRRAHHCLAPATPDSSTRPSQRAPGGRGRGDLGGDGARRRGGSRALVAEHEPRALARAEREARLRRARRRRSSGTEACRRSVRSRAGEAHAAVRRAACGTSRA